MWVDANGTCHTVALPDPTDLMSVGFRDSLDRLYRQRAEQVIDMIATEERRFFRERARGAPPSADEREFEGLTPRLGMLVPQVTTVEELRACLRSVEPRWRLDVILALGDYCS